MARVIASKDAAWFIFTHHADNFRVKQQKLLSKAKKYLWVKKLNFFCGQVQIIFCSHPAAKGHQSAADFSQPLIMALLYIYI